MNKIKSINLSLIDEFPNHPYRVMEDESFNELLNSIKENGLLNPLIVRPKEKGRYELISGHRRKLALEKLNIVEVCVDVRELSDNEAVILMVDSNFTRDKILPSEKAFAYKMRYEAMKHQGKATSGPEVQKLKSSEKLSEQYDEGERNIRRYIRLTYLIPELRNLVDNTVLYDKRTNLTMGLKPAVELSYLNEEDQKLVYTSIFYNDLTPSHDQAIRIRKLSDNHTLEYSTLTEILTELKGNQREKISFSREKLEKVLPDGLLKRDKRYVEQYIINAIENYKDKYYEGGDNYDLGI